MSSPHPSVAASTRSNPRRKRRADVEDGGTVIKQPQRKRTKLSSAVPQPQAETEAVQDGRGTNGSVSKLNQDVAVRERVIAFAPKRAVKDDGAIILVSLQLYQPKRTMLIGRGRRIIQSIM